MTKRIEDIVPAVAFRDMRDVSALFRKIGPEKMLPAGLDLVGLLMDHCDNEDQVQQWAMVVAVLLNLVGSLPHSGARMAVIQGLLIMDQEGYTPERITEA